MIIDVQTLQLWGKSKRIELLWIPLVWISRTNSNIYSISLINEHVYVNNKILECILYIHLFCVSLHAIAQTCKKNKLTWNTYHDNSPRFWIKNSLQRSWKQVMATGPMTGWRWIELAWFIELSYRQTGDHTCTCIFCQGIQRVCPQREAVAKNVTRL